MSAYEVSVVLFELRDLIQWIVPVLVAVAVCTTAYLLWRRWLSSRSVEELNGVRKRLDDLEARVKALETERAGE